MTTEGQTPVDAHGHRLGSSLARRQYLAVIRHELRTPINHIIGYSEILQEDAEERGQEGFFHDLGRILSAGRELTAIVGARLDPAKTEAGDISFSRLRHELRTPLNAVIGYSEMLQEEAGEQNQEHFIPDLQKIDSAAKHLLAFVNDRLTASEFEPGSVTTEKVTSRVPVITPDGNNTIFPSEGADTHTLRTELGSLLVVDDNEMDRDMLSRRLERQGHTVAVADSGPQALDLLKSHSFDLVLLDVMMPDMNGYQVLEHLKSDHALRHIPVIMLSALDEMDSVVRCIELGAEDYLPKPFDPVMLRARTGACLEKKRLRDQEVFYLKQIQKEKKRADDLLLNILPGPVAERLKEGEKNIADSFNEVTVLFSDIVGFTNLSQTVSPRQLVDFLNKIFSGFDELSEKHNLEKIKTIGDAYMVVGGLPIPRVDHAEAIADMALDMQKFITQFNEENNIDVEIRVGINSGPVVAGVVGTKKFLYDIWGDAVNTAARMESYGEGGRIHITSETHLILRDKYEFEDRGIIDVKGKGNMHTYFLKGELIPTASDGSVA